MAQETFYKRFAQLSLSDNSTKNDCNRNRRRTLPQAKKIRKIPNMMGIPKSVEKCYRADYRFGRDIERFITLDECDEEYDFVLDQLPPFFVVNKIEKVINPYIKIPFELKRKYIYNNIESMLLFHGTKRKYVDDICTYNFDWRLNGSERGHRYGQGVNFTPRANFAIKFCDKYFKKVIILAEVLVKNTIVGTEGTLVSPKGYDTTIKENGDVYVKFYDSEFCPLYIIYIYHRNRRYY